MVTLPELDAREGFTCYTDGSCFHKDRCGGWAWVAFDLFDRMALDGGFEIDTTINRMELMAPAKALEQIFVLHGPSIVLVVSDSEYVVKGINDRTRKRNNNADLWVRLEAAMWRHELVEFEHTRGHAKDLGNIEADRIAGEQRRAAMYVSSALA